MGPAEILFIAVVLILLYMILNFHGFASENDVLKERLQNIITDNAKQPSAPAPKPEVVIEIREKPGKKRLYEILQNIGKIITPGKISQNISRKLEHAYIPLKANEFAAVNLLSTVIPLSLGMMIFKSFIYGIIAGAVGFYFPHFVLNGKVKKRRRQFQDQMLDNLVMLSNSLKAGYSFLQGLDLLSRESPPPSSEEYSRIVRENAMGMDLEKSLRDLNDRVSSEDFDLVVTVILIQRQIGGNLSEILDAISSTIRERIRIKGQIQTLTAQARLSGIIVALLPVGIFLVFSLIRPDLMKTFFTFEEGWFKGYYMMIVGVFMQVVGFMIIRVITNIEV